MAQALSEVALFEVFDLAAAARLAELLADRWEVAVSAEGREVMVVLVELWPEPDDIATLLRRVEAWVEEEGLCALRFELDGRAYVLEAGEADWALAVQAAGACAAEDRRARLFEALRSVDRAMAALRASRGRGPHVRGLEGLRQEIVLALRLEDESS